MKVFTSITCSIGGHDKVIKALLDLKIPKEKIFSLFGPIDLLIQFNDLDNLDEFIEKWFNPIRMIGAEEDLITDTLTFIVIKEGPQLNEKPFAFIFFKTQPRKLEEIQKTLLIIPEILSVDTVFGPYDIICQVRAHNRAELERIVAYIRSNVSGIEQTMTTIVAIDRFGHLSFG